MGYPVAYRAGAWELGVAKPQAGSAAGSQKRSQAPTPANDNTPAPANDNSAGISAGAFDLALMLGQASPWVRTATTAYEVAKFAYDIATVLYVPSNWAACSPSLACVCYGGPAANYCGQPHIGWLAVGCASQCQAGFGTPGPVINPAWTSAGAYRPNLTNPSVKQQYRTLRRLNAGPVPGFIDLPSPDIWMVPEEFPALAPAAVPKVHPALQPIAKPVLDPFPDPPPYRRRAEYSYEDPYHHVGPRPEPRPEVVPTGDTVREPPGPDVKERKLNSKVVAALKVAAGTVTEADDALECIHKGMPNKSPKTGERLKRPILGRTMNGKTYMPKDAGYKTALKFGRPVHQTPQQLVKEIYNGWDFIDWDKVNLCLILSGATDYWVGRTNKATRISMASSGWTGNNRSWVPTQMGGL